MKSFFKSYKFFWRISVLAITVGLLTALSVKAVAEGLGFRDETNEDIQKIIPYDASTNDDMLSSARKNKESSTIAIAVNMASLGMICGPPYGSLTSPTCLSYSPIIIRQVQEYNISRDRAKDIQTNITDTNSDSAAQILKTSLRELEDDLLKRESQRRALGLGREGFSGTETPSTKNSLVDQELDNYVAEQVKKSQTEFERLEGEGYKYDPETQSLTLPDGTSIPAKDLSTNKGLGQLGLSDKEIKKFRKQQKEISKKAIRQGKATIAKLIKKAKLKARRLALKRTDLGSSTQQNKDKTIKVDQDTRNQNTHSASAASSGSQWQAPDFQDITSLLGEQKTDLSSQEFEGLSKRYGNGLIGVAEDNIFDMIHRRYVRKRSMFY